MYTIRKIYNYETHNTAYFQQNLTSLYNFIAHFDLNPYAEVSDKDAIGRELKENNPNYLQEYYSSTFNQIKKTVKKSQKTEMRRMVLDKISLNNIDELNRTIFDIIKVDDDFKNKILLP